MDFQGLSDPCLAVCGKFQSAQQMFCLHVSHGPRREKRRRRLCPGLRTLDGLASLIQKHGPWLSSTTQATHSWEEQGLEPEANMLREKSLFMETGEERLFSLFNRGERKLNQWDLLTHPLSYPPFQLSSVSLTRHTQFTILLLALPPSPCPQTQAPLQLLQTVLQSCGKTLVPGREELCMAGCCYRLNVPFPPFLC